MAAAHRHNMAQSQPESYGNDPSMLWGARWQNRGADNEWHDRNESIKAGGYLILN